MKYRVGGGRTGRIRWGVIGQHGALTPGQARDIAQRWAAEIAAGGDPAGEKVDKRKSPTVSELMDQYLENHVTAKNKASTTRNIKSLIDSLIRPALGRLKVADVTTSDIARFHATNANIPYQANRARSALSKAFSLAELWAIGSATLTPALTCKNFGRLLGSDICPLPNLRSLERF